MKLAAALALVLTPLLVVATDPTWHFETQSGRADGSGTKRCQKFFMKKLENFSLKLDKHKDKRSMRVKRAPEPQQGGDWGNYNNPPKDYNPGNAPNNNPGNAPNNYNPGNAPNNYNPGNAPNNNPGSAPNNYNPGSAPNNYSPGNAPNNYNPGNGNNTPNGQQPNKANNPPGNKPTNNNNNKPPNNGNDGHWSGPSKAPGIPKCCVKFYADDDCKDFDSEVCVEDKSDERRTSRGQSFKEYRGFNVVCSPDPHVY